LTSLIRSRRTYSKIWLLVSTLQAHSTSSLLAYDCHTSSLAALSKLGDAEDQLKAAASEGSDHNAAYSKLQEERNHLVGIT
jgi:hypothetical protein